MCFLLVAAPALLALLSTLVFMRIATALGICDAPGLRKVHPNPIPLLGGLAVATAVLLGFAVVCALNGNLRIAVSGAGTRGVVLLVAAAAMLFMGLFDDVRNVSASKKLLLQFVAAIVVCAAGIRLERIVFGTYTLQLGYLGWPLTIFWIVGVTNAVNLIDGLDGLATGICTIASAVIGAYAIVVGELFLGALLLALAGGLLGFLFYNFSPARIFLGDSGAYFIGFLLGASSIAVVSRSGRFEGLGVAALALGVPLFDTLFSILRRFLQRRSLFAPDRGHLHHRLLAKGLRQRKAVIIIHMVTLALALLAVLLFFAEGIVSLLVVACGVGLIVAVFRKAGAVRLRESLRVLSHNLSISREADGARKSFEQAQLRLRETVTFQDWWRAVCTTAEELELIHMSLLSARNGTQHRRDWSGPLFKTPAKRLRVTFPLRDRRKDSVLRILVEIHLNGSLEAVGRRVALFGRLMDEYGLHILDHGSTPHRAPTKAGQRFSAQANVKVASPSPGPDGIVNIRLGRKMAPTYEELGL